MSSSQVPSAFMAALAQAIGQALSAGGASEIRLIPIGDEDELDAVIERIQAEHRKTCPDCAADYAVAQTEAKNAIDALKAKPEATSAGDNQAVSDNQASVGYQAIGGVSTPERQPIGYMLFAELDGVMTPVPGSFNHKREPVEKRLAEFSAMPQIDMLIKMARALGKADVLAKHEIRPVFGE